MPQLLFKKCFFDAIHAGTKRTTIRRWLAPRVKAGDRAIVPGFGWLIIESVEVIALRELNDADAQADGFATLREMRQVLRTLYPPQQTRGDGKRWYRVTFQRDPKVAPAHPKPSPPRPGRAQRRPGFFPSPRTPRSLLKKSTVIPRIPEDRARTLLADSLRDPTPNLLR